MPAKTKQQPDDLSNPYGYSEMDWVASLDPAYAAARAEVRRLSVGEDGMRRLTLVSVSIATGPPAPARVGHCPPPTACPAR